MSDFSETGLEDNSEMPPAQPETQSRRNFLRNMGAASAVAVGGLYMFDGEKAGAYNETDEEEHPPIDTESGEHLDETHVGHEISTVNSLLAIPVMATFGNIIRKNADENDDYVLGWDSFKTIAKVESARLAGLKLFDSDAFAHEMEEIGISYTLMGVLVALSEATEHIEADEASIFESMDTIQDGLNSELDKLVIPGIEATKEQWQDFYDAKQSQVIDVASQNFALGAVLAPILTTYTTATLTNASSSRMAQHLYELNYAKGMMDSKDPQAERADVIHNAMDKTDSQMNGNFGYMKMMLTYAGNIQGMGGLGDPPNLFLLLRRGPQEWIEASGLGLAAANASALALNEVWLTKNLGVNPAKIQGSFAGKSLKSSLQIVSSGAKSMISSSKTGLSKDKEAEALFEILAGSGSDWASDERVKQQLLDISRPGISYDNDGTKKAFSHYLKDHDGLHIKALARRMFNRYEDQASIDDDNYDKKYDVEIDNALDLVQQASSKPSEMINNILGELGNVADYEAVEQLAASFDAIVSGNEVIDGDNLEFSATLNHEDAGRVEDTVEEIAGIIEQGEVDGDQLRTKFKQLVAQHAKSTGVMLPELVQDSMMKMWAQQIGADSEVHSKHGGIGHAAQEVLAALSTQILAATSASVLAEKSLSVLGEAGLSLDDQRRIVQGLTIGLSAVADNVVAYIFAETVLINIYTQEYGELTKEMEQVLSQTAWSLAISGGAHSKIGNGPNFKMYYAKPRLEEDGQVGVKREEIKFKESLKNPFALVNSAALYYIGENRVKAAEEKLIKELASA